MKTNGFRRCRIEILRLAFIDLRRRQKTNTYLKIFFIVSYIFHWFQNIFVRRQRKKSILAFQDVIHIWTKPSLVSFLIISYHIFKTS